SSRRRHTRCLSDWSSDVCSSDLTTPARFAWKRRGQRYRLLLETTLGLRLEAVAAGAQRIVEDSLLAWARLMRERHGGDRLALGGGVFMNVKANGLIADEPWVRDLFVFPSCGDESNAIGAAYLGWLARGGAAATPTPLGPAYLGPAIDPVAVEALIRARDLAGKYRVTEHERVEERIAELLVSDGVVARCAGRMEFGARVLREFERRTGIGAVLNTSFNLHGEPLVGSPEDAVDTFERSGLPHLALDRWLISKK